MLKKHLPIQIFKSDCALDRMHVQTEKLKRHGDEYVCRKKFPRINIQATCNSKEIFTSVDASWPGTVHDNRIWQNSAIQRIMHKFPNAILLDDAEYRLQPWLMTMTPFKTPNILQLFYQIKTTCEHLLLWRR